jgi:hypothetical protein
MVVPEERHPFGQGRRRAEHARTHQPRSSGLRALLPDDVLRSSAVTISARRPQREGRGRRRGRASPPPCASRAGLPTASSRVSVRTPGLRRQLDRIPSGERVARPSPRTGLAAAAAAGVHAIPAVRTAAANVTARVPASCLAPGRCTASTAGYPRVDAAACARCNSVAGARREGATARGCRAVDPRPLTWMRRSASTSSERRHGRATASPCAMARRCGSVAPVANQPAAEVRAGGARAGSSTTLPCFRKKSARSRAARRRSGRSVSGAKM